VTIVHLPDDMATVATLDNEKAVGAVGDTKSAKDKAVDVLTTALLAAMVLDDKATDAMVDTDNARTEVMTLLPQKPTTKLLALSKSWLTFC
jgi:hypothetical protein